MNEERVIAHVGEYDFCDGLREARLHGSRGLDLPAMCRVLREDGQQLDLVRYLTTRARNDPAAAKCQSSFVDRGHATVGTGELIGVAPCRRGRVAMARR